MLRILPQVLIQQQRVLEKGTGFPDGDSGEPSRLRQILLAHSNQLEQSRQQLASLNTHLTRSEEVYTLYGLVQSSSPFPLPSLPILCACSLEEEHSQVNRELDRLPRQADVEARLQDLNRQLDDLRDEIRKVCTRQYTRTCVSCAMWVVLDSTAYQGPSAVQWRTGVSAAPAVLYCAGNCELCQSGWVVHHWLLSTGGAES